MWIATGRADAATITVDTAGPPATDGQCSLLEAIQAANLDEAVDTCAAGSGADTIVVPAGSYPYYGALEISSPVEIQGAGMDATTVLGTDTMGPSIAGISLADCAYPAAVYIAVPNDRVAFTDITLAQSPGAVSEGICVVAGAITMTSARVTGFGEGGIVAWPNSTATTSLAMVGAAIDGNHSFVDGAGIDFAGDGLDVRQSEIRDNFSEGSGGGLSYVGEGDNRLVNTIVRGNTAFRGGGIFLQPKSTSYFECDGTTVTGNRAFGMGGGMFVGANGDPIPLHYSTFADNFADADPQQANLNSDYPTYGAYLVCFESTLVELSGSEWTTVPVDEDGTCRYSQSSLATTSFVGAMPVLTTL